MKNGKIIAAKVIVYAGEDDQYFTFITAEAYTTLELWMKYRGGCGEQITNDSWVMRDLWNVTKPPKKEAGGQIQEPVKLQSIGVKRLVERALWAQGIRTELECGKKRHEFQTDHGFRKWYKTQCEIGGMKPINIEKLMGHSVGISDSYYRATENELLEDYLKAISLLTISTEHRLSKQMDDIIQQSRDNDSSIKSKLYEREQEVVMLTER